MILLNLILAAVVGACVGMFADRWCQVLKRPFLQWDTNTAANTAGFWSWSRRTGFLGVCGGVAMPLLYLWMVQWRWSSLGSLADGPLAEMFPEDTATLVLRFIAIGVLFSFLLVATLIDADAMVIPDSVTIPGTILGLLFATFLPSSLPPAVAIEGYTADYEIIATASVPLNWNSPRFLPSLPSYGLFAVAIFVWCSWCMMVTDWFWHPRRSWRLNVALSLRWIRRSRRTVAVGSMAVLGTVLIAVVFFVSRSYGHVNSTYLSHWDGLFSALVGLAVGGGMIWAVRIVGTAALGREAMGFGDVTLMCMIGTFLGWQGCIFVFFLAPFAGLVFGVYQFLSGKGTALPYGPFLCAAAVATVLFWPRWWEFLMPFLLLGWVLPVILVVCLLLMGAMLLAWRRICTHLRPAVWS